MAIANVQPMNHADNFRMISIPKINFGVDVRSEDEKQTSRRTPEQLKAFGLELKRDGIINIPKACKRGTEYIMVDGRQRALALQAIGETKMPVILVEDLSDEQIKFLALQGNINVRLMKPMEIINAINALEEAGQDMSALKLGTSTVQMYKQIRSMLKDLKFDNDEKTNKRIIATLCNTIPVVELRALASDTKKAKEVLEDKTVVAALKKAELSGASDLKRKGAAGTGDKARGKKTQSGASAAAKKAVQATAAKKGVKTAKTAQQKAALEAKAANMKASKLGSDAKKKLVTMLTGKIKARLSGFTAKAKGADKKTVAYGQYMGEISALKWVLDLIV